MVTVLAHAGHGAQWQSVLALVAVGLVVVYALVISDRIVLGELGDLVVPLAIVSLVAAVAPVASDRLSDISPWAVPLGATLLVALVVFAVTDVDPTGWAAIGVTLGVTAVAVLAVRPVLDDAWIPKAGVLPPSDDAVVTIVSPLDGERVDSGTVTFEVSIEGGTFGPQTPPPPDDLEELGHLHLTVDGVLTNRIVEPFDCTITSPCTSISFDLDLEPGFHSVFVEFVAWNHLPFAPSIVDGASIQVTSG